MLEQIFRWRRKLRGSEDATTAPKEMTPSMKALACPARNRELSSRRARGLQTKSFAYLRGHQNGR